MLRFLLLLPLTLLLGCYRPQPAAPTQPERADLDYPVGSFALTARSGRTVTEKDLLGKVWVASFVFTRCTGPCPAVTASVARLQKELPNDPDLQFVTFTVDPERDREKDLTEYAGHFRADPKRWLFLTGSEKAIHTLLHDRFKLAAARRPGPNVKPGDEFDHSTRLVLVDRKGVIRATFDGLPNEQFPDAKALFEENIAKLKEKVAQLLAEK